MSRVHQPDCGRTEIEINLKWAEKHPALFVDSIKRFAQEYPVEQYIHGADFSRPHYITLIAKPRSGTNFL